MSDVMSSIGIAIIRVERRASDLYVKARLGGDLTPKEKQLIADSTKIVNALKDARDAISGYDDQLTFADV